MRLFLIGCCLLLVVSTITLGVLVYVAPVEEYE